MCYKCGTDDDSDPCRSCNPKYKPHKYADLIKAWADGAEIQVRDLTNYSKTDRESCKWKDFSYFDNEIWDNDWEYRIKPEVIRFRNFIWRTQIDELSVGVTREGDTPREFVKWLGDWQEVEV